MSAKHDQVKIDFKRERTHFCRDNTVHSIRQPLSTVYVTCLTEIVSFAFTLLLKTPNLSLKDTRNLG